MVRQDRVTVAKIEQPGPTIVNPKDGMRKTRVDPLVVEVIKIARPA